MTTPADDLPGGDGDETFEDLRRALGRLRKASDRFTRDLVWAGPDRSVALGRDDQGKVEVFVVGPPLVAASRPVRDALVHQEWSTKDGRTFEASRVALPAEPHLDSVAALVGAELLRQGVDEEPQVAFSRVEPILALALRRAALSDQALLGLIGEVVVLETLLRSVSVRAVPAVLDAWKGSAPSSRDFQIADVGIEVKTTTSTESVHKISSIHQVQLGTSVGGVAESALFLLSLGVRWLGEEAEGGLTLPALVDAVVLRLQEAGVGPQATGEFLERVRQYGGDAGLGYDHQRDRGTRRFQQQLELRFERLYDMTDEKIRLLDDAALDGLDHVDPDSVRFTARLPRRVRGDVNPVQGLRAIVDELVRRAALPSAGA